MKTDYTKIPAPRTSRVQELPMVSATELKNSFADVFDKVVASGAVAITRHDKPRAVLLSIEAYQAMQPPQLAGLEELKEEYWQMVLRMQTPEAKAAMNRAFHATPEEMGEAALAAGQRRTSAN